MITASDIERLENEVLDISVALHAGFTWDLNMKWHLAVAKLLDARNKRAGDLERTRKRDRSRIFEVVEQCREAGLQKGYLVNRLADLFAQLRDEDAKERV